MSSPASFTRLCHLLKRIPGVPWQFACEVTAGESWRVDMTIDPAHPLAWRVATTLAHAINGSGEPDGLPVTFRPIAPPPYLSQGQGIGLRWRIECHDAEFTPDALCDWLAVELPEPIDDAAKWAAPGRAAELVVILDGGQLRH